MSSISYKDLVLDLSHVLVSYIKPMNLQFTFGDQTIFLTEVFAKCGCMSLFLYDKQEFINSQLLNKKIPKKEVQAFALLQWEEDKSDSYFGLIPNIIHNLLYVDFVNIDPTIYDDLLYCLAKQILSEKDFVLKGKTIALDDKYDKFVHSMTKNPIKTTSTIAQLKGALS